MADISLEMKCEYNCAVQAALTGDSRRTQVLDEYEIDPEQNEGARHQFHDVKRKKEDRRHMCGGDCEECQGVCVWTVCLV
jgi:hypothetical protein